MPERYTYPPQVPSCQNLESADFAIACPDCPFAPECGYLAVSLALQEEAAKAVTEREKRISENTDPIIPGFYNDAGIRAILEQDPTLAEEFTSEQIGLVKVDIRGVKVMNDDISDAVGDMLIRTAGMRLLTEGARLRGDIGLSSVEQRKAWYPNKPDIGCRGKRADELYILVRHAKPDDLRAAATRISSIFSVEKAIADSAAGLVPLIGNVGCIHASDIPEKDRSSAYSMFMAMHRANPTYLGSDKNVQYDEMWQQASTVLQDGRVMPEDKREVYRYFLEAFCPNVSSRMNTLLD